jgi:hypothetical protein
MSWSDEPERDLWLTVNGHPYRLERTCTACPEQYNAWAGEGEIAGYLRLRHGHFTVEYPECGGELLMAVNYGALVGWEAGCFDPDDRVAQLAAAVEAIDERHARQETT